MRALAGRGSSTMSWPPTVTFPSVGGMKPVIMRMEVDLPAPLGPRNPRTSPRSTEKEIRLTATLGPKVFVKFSTLIIPASSVGDIAGSGNDRIGIDHSTLRTMPIPTRKPYLYTFTYLKLIALLFTLSVKSRQIDSASL